LLNYSKALNSNEERKRNEKINENEKRKGLLKEYLPKHYFWFSKTEKYVVNLLEMIELKQRSVCSLVTFVFYYIFLVTHLPNYESFC